MLQVRKDSLVWQKLERRSYSVGSCDGNTCKCYSGIYYYKKHRGGSMRATILPKAIILTKAHRAAVSIMDHNTPLDQVLPLRFFLFLLSNYIHICATIMQYPYILTRGRQQEYSQHPILPIPHFRRVVNAYSVNVNLFTLYHLSASITLFKYLQKYVHSESQL